ncbi:cytochrome C assembly family protein [Chitinasiproducens palmae]|uniref:ABC-type uncharacterized transport system, permease component n=1 Tax=Chitinasiproducens palmae TaxID=1770053 RepID=A0A1H2PSL1_9BURK|nr:cytochrome c biogenesis protein CcsA [Chitinasiproducens palmae]SDV49557.1 ABC-type uncharacterized transport system, permease component [Chitinasiproducens palmae]
MIIVLYALTALLYAGASLYVWRLRALGGTAASLLATPGAPSHAFVAPPIVRGAVAVALAAHGVLLHATIFPADSMVFGFAYALSAMLWLGVGIYWVESLFFPLDTMALLLLPAACVASLLPALFGGVRVLSYAADPMFKVHFLIANLAYGLLAIAALHALLMLWVGRRLQRPVERSVGDRWLGGWLATLPPLLTMERLLFRLIGAGFLALTATLISGVAFSEQLLGRPFVLDHKTVFALLSWLMFGSVLVGRRLRGWRGRAALRWVLASFVALLLAYVGSRFVLEVLLHRPVV